ncbi:6 kDa early secretory antigenic target [Mycobacterium marinum]|uniref:WXG100 family type VII secretion target n=1 Tax=Mycobacterium marinum TaxID=1781 RepID=UPI000E3E57E7|nr:WXG100 family type VII secretion target [Mycobacterium marinum]RFZ52074.1 6 kDa early secretory antigenic target [Mycobacterium marinum]
MAVLHYNFAAIEIGVAEIQAEVIKTQKHLHDANQVLSTLTEVWGGSGSEAYQQVQQQWDSASADLNAALQALAHAVHQSNQEMLTTETGLATLFA